MLVQSFLLGREALQGRGKVGLGEELGHKGGGTVPILQVRLKSLTQSSSSLLQQNSQCKLEDTHCSPCALTQGKGMKSPFSQGPWGTAAYSGRQVVALVSF